MLSLPNPLSLISPRTKNRWMILPVLLVIPLTFSGVCSEPANEVQDLIQEAGNADSDLDRQEVLKKLRDLPGLDADLKAEVERLIDEVDLWLNAHRLEYFDSQVRKTDDYDFGVAKDSPLLPIADLYRARMLLWVTLEHGGYWSKADARRERFAMIRPVFERAKEAFPENRILRMYLGEPIPPEIEYPAVPGAPQWAVYQREGLERLTDIITWWIDNRTRENGEYGGQWADDCEMWRWWVPVLIGFSDPKIEAAQARFSEALMDLDHMKGGYTSHVSDVEHTAEDSADVITPMMHLQPDNEVWSARAKRLVDLFENLWSGTNERGFLQFKSTYFNVEKVDPDPRKACDSVYHPRALQPALLYWQRTGDEWMGSLFTAWMDTWVDATAREERGKPAGVIPSAIHWPDGSIGGLGENWWDPENHTSDPLYVWPSAMSQMTNTLLLTYHMTKNDKYFEPIRSMAEIRLDYLENPSQESPEKGSKEWCAARMGGISEVLAKYKMLTGSTEFDRLLEKERDAYFTYRVHGEDGPVTGALERNAQALRLNFPGYTSEVRFTDRVLRFPTILQGGMMTEEAVEGIRTPDPTILYKTTTGDPGGAGYFPMNAVRWLTPPREIAALVSKSGRDGFAAELFHFGEEPRPLSAELFLLDAGEYTYALKSNEGTEAEGRLTVSGARTKIAFELPPRRLCTLVVTRSSK